MHPERTRWGLSVFLVLSIMVLSILSGVALAEGVPLGKSDPKRADGPKKEAAMLRRQADEISARHSQKPLGMLKEAAASLVTAKRNEATALEALATALEGGDPSMIKAARIEREKAGRASKTANEVFAAREAEQRNAGDPEHVERLQRTTPPELKDRLEATMRAKKAAAEAWAKLAEAAGKGALPADLESLRASAVFADGEARISFKTFEVAKEETLLAREVEKQNLPDLRKSVEELKQVGQELLAAEKQRIEAERKVRQIEAKRRAIRDRVRAAIDAVRKSGWDWSSRKDQSPSSTNASVSPLDW